MKYCQTLTKWCNDINRLHSQELQAQVTKLANQLAESERLLANRTAELDAHLQTTAMATGVSSDVKLQAQVNTLLLEKVRLDHVMSYDLMWCDVVTVRAQIVIS